MKDFTNLCNMATKTIVTMEFQLSTTPSIIFIPCCAIVLIVVVIKIFIIFTT